MPLRIVFIIGSLCWLLAAASSAATFPFLGGKAADEKEKVVALPEPAGLEVDWWHYYDAEGEALAQRIQQTSDRLQRLAEELPEATAAAAQPLIGRVQGNLQALAEARQVKAPELPPPLTYADVYSVAQLLDSAARLRTARIELQAQRDDVAAMERFVESVQTRIDTQLAAYLNLSPNHPEKVLRGLDIMAQRTLLGVAEEQLRIARAALLAQESLMRQLDDEQAVALQRLTARQEDLDRLAAEIAQARVVLEQAQERVVGEQARAVSVVSDDPEEKATARYRQQRVVNAEVVEAIAALRLIRLQAERFLTALLVDAGAVDLGELRGQVTQWNARLAAIRDQIVAWTRSSERERDRASEALAGQSEDQAVAGVLTLLNQDRLNLAQETLVALQRLDDVLAETGLLNQWLRNELVRRGGRLRAWLARTGETLEGLWEELAGRATVSLFRIGDTPVTALGLLRVALILFVAWLISYWWRYALNRVGEGREGVNQAALYTVGRLSHYVIITVGLVVGLASVGIDFTNFALLAGAFAIGIGFGLQSIVSNFVSGLILLFERSLKVGDFVELASGINGEVRAINVRSTVINTNDNVDIVVPNSNFIDHDVINWTLLEAYRRIHVPFKVAYGTDKELVRKAALEAADKLPHTLKSMNPGVWLVKFGDSSLDFELVVWITPKAVKRPGAVFAAYLWEIETALRKYGIEIPFPQRELRLRSGFDAWMPAPAVALHKVPDDKP